MICFSRRCIFLVILDLQDRRRECLSYFADHSWQQYSLRGKFYLFKIGLGIHRGMGDCVCFVAIKISALETSDSLFE